MIPQVVVAVGPPAFAHEVRDRLRQCGYVGQLAATTDAAVRRAAEVVPQLVLLDLELPGQIDAVAAAAAIRERTRVPVVVVAEAVDDAVLERTEPARPAGYVCKPCGLAELQAAVSVALVRHRRDAADAIRAQRVAQVVAQMDVGVVTTDVAGVVTHVNPAAEALTGWSAADAVGRDYAAVLPTLDPRTREPAECEATRGAAGSGQFFLLRRRDGAAVPVLMSLAGLTKPDGRMDGLAFSLRPFTPSDDATGARAELEALRALTNGPAGLFRLDAEGRVRAANATLATLTGQPPTADLTGRVLLGDVLPGEWPAGATAIDVGGLHVRVATDATGAVGVALPIPAAPPSRLAELDALQRSFGPVVRQVNNAAVLARGEGRRLLTRLRDVLHDDRVTVGHAETLQEWLDRDAHTLAALGDFAGWQAVRPEPVSLADVVTEQADGWRHTLGAGRPLTVDVTSPTQAMADTTAVARVLAVLIDNARDALPNGGPVGVRVRPVRLDRSPAGVLPPLAPGDYVAVEVTDAGPGVPAELLARLFEPLPRTAKRSGLGLAGVYGAADHLDGGVEVQTAPGRGTTVRVYLPAATEPRPAALVFAASRASRNRLRESVHAAGYQPLRADHTGDILLHVTRPDPPTLLVAEVGLHDAGFREAVAEAGRAEPRLRVVCVSHQPHDLLLYAGVMAGGWGYLPATAGHDAVVAAVTG